MSGDANIRAIEYHRAKNHVLELNESRHGQETTDACCQNVLPRNIFLINNCLWKKNMMILDSFGRSCGSRKYLFGDIYIQSIPSQGRHKTSEPVTPGEASDQ